MTGRLRMTFLVYTKRERDPSTRQISNYKPNLSSPRPEPISVADQFYHPSLQGTGCR